MAGRRDGREPDARRAAVLAAILFSSRRRLVPIITPGFEPAAAGPEVELTRIMLLSPIFLALGSMATSVLNSRGQFAAAAIAPIVYNLAIIGGSDPPRAVARRRPASRSPSSPGRSATCSSSCRRLRRLGYRYTPTHRRHDPQARRAFALMAPRAVGLGAAQITFVVVTALAHDARAPAASPRSTSRSCCSRSRSA